MNIERNILGTIISGGAQLKQVADLVMLLYRPASYGIGEVMVGGIPVDTKNTGYLDIPKQRDGATGTIVFSYNDQFSQIEDKM